MTIGVSLPAFTIASVDLKEKEQYGEAIHINRGNVVFTRAS
jgi:hypothetical protein